MKRREFIKAASVAAVAASIASRASAAEDMALQGATDLHVHCQPDSMPRKIHALDYARDCQKLGYSAIMLKCHQFNTNEMADVISKVVSGIEVFGSITLNLTWGNKINLFAVKQATAMSDKRLRCVWLPTQAAVGDLKAKGKTGGIPVVDEQGKVVPEVIKLMEFCGENDLLLGTGHASPEEDVILARKAQEIGFKKLVCTHVSSANRYNYTLDDAKKCLEAGAWLEHSMVTYFDLKAPQDLIRRIVAFIKLDPSRQFIDTDLGQVKNPHPCDAMRLFYKELMDHGLSAETIRTVNHDVPLKLVRMA